MWQTAFLDSFFTLLVCISSLTLLSKNLSLLQLVPEHALRSARPYFQVRAMRSADDRLYYERIMRSTESNIYWGKIYSEVNEKRLHYSNSFILTCLILLCVVKLMCVSTWQVGVVSRAGGRALFCWPRVLAAGLLQQTFGCCHSQSHPSTNNSEK